LVSRIGFERPPQGGFSYKSQRIPSRAMKFVEPSQFTDPDAAAHRLVEIANGIEAVQDGRIYIESVNAAFLGAGGTPDLYRAALAHAIKLGWLWKQESGTYVRFTPAGAELFA
jgi:hypothetical protein